MITKPLLLDETGRDIAAAIRETGRPTDEQVNRWLDNHPEATTTVGDGAITEAKLNAEVVKRRAVWFNSVQEMKESTLLQAGMYACTSGYYEPNDGGEATYRIRTKVSGDTPNEMSLVSIGSGSMVAERIQSPGVQKIGLDELETVSAGIYTLGTVTVDSPVTLKNVENRNITIVNTVFNINCETLFPPRSNSGYFILPNFVGCTFNNVYGQRTCISTGSSNTVGGRVSGCVFNNVDFVVGGYIQAMNFVSCYINSHTCFLDSPDSTVQGYFVQCNTESYCNKLIACSKILLEISGTYEGNQAKNEYLITCRYGVIKIDSCYLESERFLYCYGGDVYYKRTSVTIVSSIISGNPDESLYPFYFDNASLVRLYLVGTFFDHYNRNSKFTNKNIGDFYRVTGCLETEGAETYPFNGEKDSGNRIVSERVLQASIDEKFKKYKVVSSNRESIELPVGTYLVFATKGDYSTVSAARGMIVSASTESSTLTKTIDIISCNSVDLNSLSFTLTKSENNSETFTIVAYSETRFFVGLSIIKI